MDFDPKLEQVKAYFDQKLAEHGATPQGVDWNSDFSQTLRFDQILKVCDFNQKFSLIDWGCGWGALAGYLAEKEVSFEYWGYDLSNRMIRQARETFKGQPHLHFTDQEIDLSEADYVVSSGIFNLKLDASLVSWTEHVLRTLEKMNALSRRGFAFNLLTRYSDADRKRPDLYYADPCFLFDYCKRRFSRNVALLHDYDLYDFTVLVRKLLR